MLCMCIYIHYSMRTLMHKKSIFDWLDTKEIYDTTVDFTSGQWCLSNGLFGTLLLLCRYSGVWLVTRCGSLMKSGYDISEWMLCIVILVINGILFRCIAFFCMVTFLRNWGIQIPYLLVCLYEPQSILIYYSNWELYKKMNRS